MPRLRKPQDEPPQAPAANTDELEQRLDQLAQRYRRQFHALDSLITSLRSTSDLLKRQLTRLPKLDK